jgi:hypothetical protein
MWCVTLIRFWVLTGSSVVLSVSRILYTNYFVVETSTYIFSSSYHQLHFRRGITDHNIHENFLLFGDFEKYVHSIRECRCTKNCL